MRTWRFCSAGVAVVSLLSGCNLATLAVTAWSPYSRSALAQALPDMTYPIADAHPSGSVTLNKGVFEEPAAPGSASMNRVWLGEPRGYGDLDGDGDIDAAVNLIHSRGGSGTFYYLTAVLAGDEEPEALNSIFLGDRITVRSLRIESGAIVADLLTRSATGPMATPPSIETRRRFVVENGKLREVHHLPPPRSTGVQ